MRKFFIIAFLLNYTEHAMQCTASAHNEPLDDSITKESICIASQNLRWGDKITDETLLKSTVDILFEVFGSTIQTPPQRTSEKDWEVNLGIIIQKALIFSDQDFSKIRDFFTFIKYYVDRSITEISNKNSEYYCLSDELRHVPYDVFNEYVKPLSLFNSEPVEYMCTSFIGAFYDVFSSRDAARSSEMAFKLLKRYLDCFLSDLKAKEATMITNDQRNAFHALCRELRSEINYNEEAARFLATFGKSPTEIQYDRSWFIIPEGEEEPEIKE